MNAYCNEHHACIEFCKPVHCNDQKLLVEPYKKDFWIIITLLDQLLINILHLFWNWSKVEHAIMWQVFLVKIKLTIYARTYNLLHFTAFIQQLQCFGMKKIKNHFFKFRNDMTKVNFFCKIIYFYNFPFYWLLKMLPWQPNVTKKYKNLGKDKRNNCQNVWKVVGLLLYGSWFYLDLSVNPLIL